MPNTSERSSTEHVSLMALIRIILLECQGKSPILVGSKETGRKEIGNCMYRQVLQKNIAVNGSREMK